MKKKTYWIGSGALFAAGAIAFYFFYAAPEASGQQPGGRRGMNGNGRPIPVVVAAARSGDIDVVVSALGTVTARNTVTVKPRVDGQLIRVPFREGQVVKAGELLAEIDPRPFQVLLDQASGQLQRDQALLANAELDAERYRGLLAKDSIARQQVDAQEALVRQYRGTVLSDRAQVDNAKLQLGFTRVTAPLGGRLGLRQVDVGNMVRASDATGLVVITQTQPIATVFAIPSDSLAPVLERHQAGQALQVEAYDREGKLKLASGSLLTIDNLIDTATGTVKLKAEFANDKNTLFPNQFVNVRLRTETRHGATLIPVAAVQRGTQGTFVYVANAEEKTVGLRPVTLGPSTADTVAVEKGLAPDELVVVDGADKLRQGAKVELSQGDSKPAGAKPPRGEGRGGKPGEGRGKRWQERGDAAAAPAERKSGE